MRGVGVVSFGMVVVVVVVVVVDVVAADDDIASGSGIVCGGAVVTRPTGTGGPILEAGAVGSAAAGVAGNCGVWATAKPAQTSTAATNRRLATPQTARRLKSGEWKVSIACIL